MARFPGLALAILGVTATSCWVNPNANLLRDAARLDRADAGPTDLLGEPAADRAPSETAAGDQVVGENGRPPEARPSAEVRPPEQRPADRAPADASPPLGKGNARLLYGESGNKLLARGWDVSSGTWSSPIAAALPASKSLTAVVNKVSPILAGDEVAVGLVGDLAGTSLGGISRSGSTWTLDWSSSAIPAVHADKRGFDLEYETLTGEVLAVYARNSATPAFRTRAGSSWSAEQILPLNDAAGPNPDVNSGSVLWVELTPRPGTNEIALAYADEKGVLVFLLWDGTKWDNASAKALATDLKLNPSTNVVHQRAFDAAYETSTGNLMMAWGRQGVSQFGSAVRSASTKLWGPAQYLPVVSGMIELVDLASHPAINFIAATLIDQGNGVERLGLSVWQGSAFVNTVEADSQMRDVNDTAFGDFPGAVAWVGTSGTAVCVYSDNEAGTVDWAKWTSPTGWVVQTDLAIAAKGYTESVLLQTVPDQGKVLGVLSDSNGALWSVLFDGTKWTALNGGAALTTQLSSVSSLPFSFDFQVK